MYVHGMGKRSYLGEGSRVNPVFGGKLEPNGGVGLGIPGCTSSSLDGRVHLLVIRSAEDAERVGCGDGGVVDGGGITDGGGVLGDGSFLHVVPDFTTDEEALVAENGIGNGADSTAGLEVGKDPTVEVILLEVEVGLLSLVPIIGVEVVEKLGLETRRDGVAQLNLGSKKVGRVPRLSNADACRAFRQ